MGLKTNGVRRLISAPVKRLLLPLVTSLRATRRTWRLRRGVARLRREAAAQAVSGETLSDLREAWGNLSYSADLSYLIQVARACLAPPGPFLECGSGLTTLVAGTILDVRGAELYSLEDEEDWHRQVASELSRLGVGSVRLVHGPLRDYGPFAWYDLEGVALPSAFSHLFCDGPAIFKDRWPPAVHARWRSGVVPVLQDRGVAVGEILLDDASDNRSAELRRQWEERGMVTEVVHTPTGAHIVARPRAERR